MSVTIPDSPGLLDSTGQVMVQKLQGIINALGGGGATVVIEDYDSSVLRYPNTNEDGGLTYKVGDYCKYNNTIYRCINPVNYVEATPVQFTQSSWEEATDNIVVELSNRPGKIVLVPYDSGVGICEVSGFESSHTFYPSLYGHQYCHVEGGNNYIGNNNRVSVSFGHAEGYMNHLEGSFAHVEGSNNSASGTYSHSEGYSCQANGVFTHAEGNGCYAYGGFSHVEGYGCTAGKSDQVNSTTWGGYSHVEGGSCAAYGQYNHVEGYSCRSGTSSSTTYCSHVEGYNNTDYSAYSHVEGSNNSNYGTYNHIEGTYNSSCYGHYLHVEGYSNTIDSSMTCVYTHIEGNSNKVYKNSSNNQPAQNSHIEGYGNYVYSTQAGHVEGYGNYLYGTMAAHAEGYYCYANSPMSHVGGLYSYAGAQNRQDSSGTFAHGAYVRTYNAAEAGFGTYNDSKDNRGDILSYNSSTSYSAGSKVKHGNDGIIYEANDSTTGEWDATKWDATQDTYSTNPTIFSVGNGTDQSHRSNAFEVLIDGTGYLKNNKRIITTEEVPDPPASDGVYTLQVTVSNGQLTYAWV